MTKQQDQIDIAVIKDSLQNIKEDIRGILNRLDEQDKKYLTKEEFDPYKRIIQGLVALVLTAVVTALMALVIKK